MYDLVIKNGMIIDGTGGPSYFSDVAIQDEKIVHVAKGIREGKEVIDAAGLTVTPGFIDSHSHSDKALISHPDLIEKIEQGITTSIGGQCGSSPAPISRDITPENAKNFGELGKETDIYRTMGTFLDITKKLSFGSNTACLVGHGALRMAVMGTEKRKPTDDELEKMKELLRDGIEHGALGVSFGLIYPPSCYAETDELIEIAKVVGEYNGIVAAHIRNEGDFLTKSVDEFIEIVKESGTRGVISHHKAGGKQNWGKVNHTLRMIDEANEAGVEVYCDVYPYIASNTSLAVTVVPDSGQNLLERLADKEERKKFKEWAIERWNGDLSWIQINTCAPYPEYEGLRIPEIAKLHGTDEYDAMYDMIADSNNVCFACYFTMCEEDVKTVLAHPRAMVCTDSGIAGSRSVFHPRLKGTFPRVLGKYVREEGVTSLSEMIRKITSMPASVYGLKTKGLIWEGMDADICIFDAGKIADHSKYTDCNRRAEGLSYVILGGEVVAEDAVYNGKRKGNLILR